ncbi:cytochrome P450 2D14-like [Nelusetta ayraudi]|uniref:cytochrome P450 2D14-like n=1 Tax=Nelusetta ayraudi TaxID=303726 RepID=UPI003F6F09BD
MFLSAALLVGAVLLIVIFSLNQRSKNLPPGPRPLPIFGNLLDLNLNDPVPEMERLAKLYGNVFTFYIGFRPVVVLNGLQAVKEALVNKASDFSGRPLNSLAKNSAHPEAHAPGVILADYNFSWKEQRRFGLMSLRNFGLGKQSMEERINDEIQYIVAVLEKNIGKPMNPRLLFHKAASNIICQVLFAKHFDYEDQFLDFFANFFHETSKIINGPKSIIYDFIPPARKMPVIFRRIFHLFKRSCDQYSEIVAESRKNRVPGQPRHFMDCYLDELDKRGDDSSSFNDDQLIAYLLDLHFAGTDTTANTVLFAILYLMTYPEVQERFHQELDRVIDEKGQIKFEDRHQMPYVQAVLHESQRMASTVPLSVFHCTTKDTEVLGYSIPEGTTVIPNLTSVLMDKDHWKFPHEFNPENFLNDKGEFVKPDAFVPFSVGPRTCLGEGLARMELFLIIVTLLQRFKFSWPEKAGKPDLTPVYGVTQTPKPYSMTVQLR